MDLKQILKLMENAGFRIQGISPDGQIINIEDPACVLRAFATFAEYAWLGLVCVTGLLLFGWAISMIRGAKNDVFTNMRNLILIFGITAAAGPIINAIYGDNLFAKGCKSTQVSVSDVQALLDARNAKLSLRHDDLYEEFDIYDTGAIIPDAPDTDAIEPTVTIENPPKPTDNANKPISATGAGKDVLYTYADQSQMRRSQGSRAWRNNNPGNIRPGKFTDSVGDIGQAGNFAVFPDETTGMDAIIALLKTSKYQNKTLAAAISSWAPPSDGNNTSAYQNQVQQAVGVSLNTMVKDLTDAQLRQVASEIRRVEGWTPGTQTREKGA